MLNIGFWDNDRNWPADSKSHVFLARTLQALGPEMFLDEWKGNETKIVRVDKLPPYPFSNFRDRQKVHSLLEGDTDYEEKVIYIEFPPSIEPLKPSVSKAHDYDFTVEEWIKADKLNESYINARKPGLLRLDQVKARIVEELISGRLEGYIKLPGSNEFAPVPEDIWATIKIDKTFERCALNAPVYVGGDEHPIFITRASFLAFLERLRATAFEGVGELHPGERRTATKNVTIDRAIRHLTGILRASPDLTRKDALQSCKILGSISENAFRTRVWRQARDAAGLPPAKGGRPSLKAKTPAVSSVR